MKDWRSLGSAHRRRDEAVASIARGQGERDTARSTGSLARWPGIVSAIRSMVAAYNDGAGHEVLVVTETSDGQHPTATIASTASTIPSLRVALDEAEIRVDTQSVTSDSGGIKRWVDLTRSDEDTAAYVLQEWMERL
jgi:hypothetical protein